MLGNHRKRSEVDFERVSILYQNAPLTIVGVLAAFVTLLLAIWNSLPLNLVLFWSALIGVSLLPRLFLILKYSRESKTREREQMNARFWEKCWAATTIFPALAFACLAYFPFESDQLIAMLFIALMLVGMDAGSIMSSNTSLMTVMLFFNFTSLPFIARCFLQDEHYYNVLGGFYSIFYLVFTRLAILSNRTITRSIELQYENKLLSLKDSLTGLWNRRSLHPYVDQLIRQNKRNQETFSVVLLDIDYFKRINDTRGHSVGDSILRQVADCIVGCSREGDLALRYGGEEFLLVMPSSETQVAVQVAERILGAVSALCNITVSAGVATYVDHETFDELIKQADSAMYTAKDIGRNRVVVAQRNVKSNEAAFDRVEA